MLRAAISNEVKLHVTCTLIVIRGDRGKHNTRDAHDICAFHFLPMHDREELTACGVTQLSQSRAE